MFPMLMEPEGLLKKDQPLHLRYIITRGPCHRKKVEPREGSGLNGTALGRHNRPGSLWPQLSFSINSCF